MRSTGIRIFNIAIVTSILLTGCATPQAGVPAAAPTAEVADSGQPAATTDEPEPVTMAQPTSPPPAPAPQPTAPSPSPPPQSPVERTVQADDAQAVDDAVANAYRAGAGRVSRLPIAVLDLRTGTLSGAGDVDEPYASASVVKVFIAARLLVDGQAEDPAVRDRMWRMITLSDDDAGTSLYALAGGQQLMPWIAQRYGVEGLAPTPDPGYWGLTRITARGLVAFYAAVAADPAVAPWLLDAMAHTEAHGADGFDQHFGIPSAAVSWRVKQGWMCCLDGVTRMHSTGYIDNDRYAVALLTEGPRSLYGDSGGQILTDVAQALLVDGALDPAGSA